VQVLAGVVEVHDLGGLGEVLGGEIPDPGRAVAGNTSWRMRAAPRRRASAAIKIPSSAAGAKVAR